MYVYVYSFVMLEFQIEASSMTKGYDTHHTSFLVQYQQNLAATHFLREMHHFFMAQMSFPPRANSSSSLLI